MSNHEWRRREWRVWDEVRIEIFPKVRGSLIATFSRIDDANYVIETIDTATKLERRLERATEALKAVEDLSNAASMYGIAEIAEKALAELNPQDKRES